MDSAALCRQGRKFTQSSPDQLTALLGAHDLQDPAAGQEVRKVDQLRVRRDYDPIEVLNDIALIKLASPVYFSDTIRPICLPEQGEALPVGKDCAAAGWGRVESKNEWQIVR
jgi:hypothetical protein